GRRLTGERATAHGHPSDAMDDGELCAKFVSLATPRLSERVAQRLARDVLEAKADAPAGLVLAPVLGRREAVHPPSARHRPDAETDRQATRRPAQEATIVAGDDL